MRQELADSALFDELVAIVVEWAEANPEIARVHLFGSRVRGRSKDDKPVSSSNGRDE